MNAWALLCDQLMGSAPPPPPVVSGDPEQKKILCKWCEREFTPDINQKYCTIKCRDAMGLMMNRERRARNAAAPRYYTCCDCHRKFDLNGASHRKRCQPCKSKKKNLQRRQTA